MFTIQQHPHVWGGRGGELANEWIHNSSRIWVCGLCSKLLLSVYTPTVEIRATGAGQSHAKARLNGRVAGARNGQQEKNGAEWSLKVKVHALDIAPLRSESLPQKRSGMARVLKGFHSFTCTLRRSSAIGMSHTCLCLPSYSWYAFTDPGGMEGWVDLGAK